MDDKIAKKQLDDVLASERERIDELDTNLLELLAKRRDAINRVASLKREHGLAVYHPAREEDLISKRRAQAGRLDLDPDMIEEIFRKVLRGSRITQTRSLADKAVKPGATVLMVGGLGAMGQCLGQWFSSAGYTVRVLDKEDWDNAEKLCQGVDLALLSVPIAVTEQTARRISKFISPACVLADITSNKAGPLKAMLKAHPGPVLGLHPMFGPTTHALDKQIVVVTQGRDGDSCRWVVDQFADWGAVIVNAEAEEHDAAMDVVQGLRHFATFAFGQFLSRSDIDLERTLEFSSPIYRLELGMVGRLFAQDPELYADIIFSSPQRRELLCRYVEGLAQNIEVLRNADVDAFLEEFKRIAEWFGPFSDQAIRESTFLIDKMIERF